MACDPKITYKGKEYSYGEFMSILNDGLIDAKQLERVLKGEEAELIINNDYTPNEKLGVAIEEPTEKEVENSMQEAEGKVERTLVKLRAFEGDVDPLVKKFLGNDLYRYVDSAAAAEISADNLIAEVGFGKAVEMAAENKVTGATQSALLGREWLRRQEALDIAETPSEKRKASKDIAFWMDKVIGSIQEATGAANAFWRVFYAENPNLGLNVSERIKKWEELSGEKWSREQKAEYEKVQEDLKELQKKYNELEAMRPDAEMQSAIDDISESSKRGKESYKAKAKEIADQFRKLKSKPITLKDAKGNDLLDKEGKPITLKMQGLNFNELIEVGAKAIEKTGEIADGIVAIKKKLEEEDWYKGLSKEDKDAVAKQIETSIDYTPESKEFDPNDPLTSSVLKDLVKNGYNTPEKLLGKLREYYPKTSDRDIRDRITKYGQEVNITEDSIRDRLTAIKRVFAMNSQLEDALGGKRPLKRGVFKRDVLDEERELGRRIKEAMKNLDVNLPELDNQLKSQLEANKTRLKNRMTDMLTAIESGEAMVKMKKVKLTDNDLEDLREAYEVVKDSYEEAFGKTELTEGEKKIQELEKKLAAIGKEKAKKENIEPEYTASEIIDIEALENQIAARRKAVKMEGATLKTEAEKNIEKLQKRLDDIRFGAEKRTSEKRELSQEEKDLVEQIKDERAKQGDKKAKRTKEEIKLESLEKGITDINQMIALGDLEIKRASSEEKSLAVQAKVDALKEAREMLYEARKEAGIIEAERIKQAVKYLEKRKEYYEKRKAEGDYSKRPKPTPPITEELNKLRSEIDKLKFEDQKQQHLAEQKALSKGAKFAQVLGGVWDLPRISMATGELSFVGMQGRRLTMSYLLKNPSVVKDAFVQMAKNFGSQEKADEFTDKLKQDPNYHIKKASKLDLTEQSYKTAAAEENTLRSVATWTWKLSSMAVAAPIDYAYKKATGKDLGLQKDLEKINPMTKFERAAFGYLNVLRNKAFDDGAAILRNNGKTFESDPKAYKALANYINTATGRGRLGALEPAAEGLSKVLFSPRMFSTELQLATTPFGAAKLLDLYTQDKTAAKIAASHQIRSTLLTLGTGAALTGLALMVMGKTDENEDGTGVELDPRSPKFGRIKFKGGREVDFFNGLARYAVLAARIESGETKTYEKDPKTGNVKSEIKSLGLKNETEAVADLVVRIVANKINPTLGEIYEYNSAPYANKQEGFLGKGKEGEFKQYGEGIKRSYGEEVSIQNSLETLLRPIFWRQAQEVLKEEPNAIDAIGLTLGFIGLGGYNLKGVEAEAKKKELQERLEKRKKELKKLIRKSSGQ